MAIDYISTKPWNDPLNPWFGYTQMHMGGSIITDEGNTINLNILLNLTQFDPEGNEYGNTPAAFISEDGADPLILLTYFSDIGWTINMNSLESPGLYLQQTCEGSKPPRDILKYNQMCWTGNGTGFPTMSPVLSSVAGWEKRRLWNLNG